MPTYEYRCPRGHDFEFFQRMSDEPRAPCPECGEEAARLLSSGAGFLFRGDGFYITDYRSDDYRKAAKSETKDTGSTTGSGVGGDKAGDKAGSDSAAPATGGSPLKKGAASKDSTPSASPAAASKPSPASPGGASGSP